MQAHKIKQQSRETWTCISRQWFKQKRHRRCCCCWRSWWRRGGVSRLCSNCRGARWWPWRPRQASPSRRHGPRYSWNSQQPSFVRVISPFLPPPTMPRPTIRGSANWRHLYPTFFRLCHLLQNMALCTSPLESQLYVQDVPGSNPASNWAISFHECLLRSCCSYCEAVLGEISWDCRPDPDRKSGF